MTVRWRFAPCAPPLHCHAIVARIWSSPNKEGDVALAWRSGVMAQTLYLLQGCGVPPPFRYPPPLKKSPISEPHNHLCTCCTRLASQGASRHWHPDRCHLLLLLAAAAAAHEEFYEQQLSKRSRFQLTSPCQSVKSRRGWEEGDGTENVMSCRQVTLYDALWRFMSSGERDGNCLGPAKTYILRGTARQLDNERFIERRAPVRGTEGLSCNRNRAPFRKRAEYCFESTVSEKRTHWASLSFGANSVSSAENSVSSRLHTNNRLKGTHWVRSPELSEPRKTHWARCLKPYSPKPYSVRYRAPFDCATTLLTAPVPRSCYLRFNCRSSRESSKKGPFYRSWLDLRNCQKKTSQKLKLSQDVSICHNLEDHPNFRKNALGVKRPFSELSESSGVFSEQLSEFKIPFSEYEIPFSEWHPTTWAIRNPQFSEQLPEWFPEFMGTHMKYFHLPMHSRRVFSRIGVVPARQKYIIT